MVGLRDVLEVVEVVRKANNLLTTRAEEKSVEGGKDGDADGVQIARRSIHVPTG